MMRGLREKLLKSRTDAPPQPSLLGKEPLGDGEQFHPNGKVASWYSGQFCPFWGRVGGGAITLHGLVLVAIALIVAVLLHPFTLAPQVLAEAEEATVLLTDAFTYADGTTIDQVAANLWRGRYPLPDISAVAQGGQARLNPWRALSTVATFLNRRDIYTRVAVDLLGAGGINYMMDVGGAYGVSVSYDGNNRVTVRSNNLGNLPTTNSQSFKVVSAGKKVHIDLYLRDQSSQLFVTDDQGTQATPLWFNADLFGNIAYRLSLGYGGTYDNVLVEYRTDGVPAQPAPRAPLLVTPNLVEGVVNQRYILPQADWMMTRGIFQRQQVRADGGVAPLTYTLLNGALPPGLSLTSVYTQPTSDTSPPQWVGVLAGTPTTAGAYAFDVKVTDALGRTDQLRYTLTVNPQAPPRIAFSEAFTGTNGAVINDKPGSQWTGRYGAQTVSAVYEQNRARIQPWMTLSPLLRFRNATSRYLHTGAQVFQGTPSALTLTCGGNGFGLTASYDGNRTLLVRSNNLGYAPQTLSDTLVITSNVGAAIQLDLYIKGADTRVYVTSNGQMQATEVRHNTRLEGACERGDYSLSLGYAGLYDNIVVEDVPLLPELYNPVRIVTEAVLRGYQSVDYTDVLTATAGKLPYIWSATDLPPGLTLAANGALTGVPNTPGTYPTAFTVTDALGQRARRSAPMTIEANPDGNLLFADRFTLPGELWLATRDRAHWASLAHTPFALIYSTPPGLPKTTGENWLTVQPHKQGFLTVPFANDGVTPLAFRWRMTKGRGSVTQVGTCWGMRVEYDGIQRVAVHWNDMCYQPYMLQQDFLLDRLQEIITATIEVKGQQFALRVEDSKQSYLRGPFTANRVQVEQPVSFQVSDNTPYGEGRYTSYQAGPSYFDDLTVHRNVWTVVNGAPLRNKEELGRLLFFDPLLSGNNQHACATCHQPNRGFTDGRTKALGLNGQPLTRNTPGLTNLALQSAFFWEGREANLERLALHPIQNVQELNQPLPALAAEVAAIPAYQQRFAALWPDGVTAEHLAEALAAYSRTLLELRTPYDTNLYWQGTLTAEEDAGLILFNGKANCSQCHELTPVTAIGNKSYNLPVFKALGVPADTGGTAVDGDLGRAVVTGDAAESGVFRTPNLRNLTRTAPYMHNGVFTTLEAVVDFYNKGGGRGLGLAVPNQAVQVMPLGLTDTEQQQLVAFLKALSPQYPNYVEIPSQVPSGLLVAGAGDVGQAPDGVDANQPGQDQRLFLPIIQQ